MSGSRQESRRTNYCDYKGPPVTRPTKQASPIVKRFDAVGDVIRFVDSNRPLWPDSPESAVVAQSAEDCEWLGTTTWAEARRLALLGWPEGRNWLIAAAQHNVLAARVRAPEWMYDVAGAFPDVPRFIAGDPESMVARAPTAKKTRRVIRLALSPNCSKDTSPQERAAWGAAVLSWIDAEEAAGHIVEIDLVYLTRPYYEWMVGDLELSPWLFVTIGLKRSSALLSIADLAFWLMHNAAHRRVQFAIRERLDVARWYNAGHIYGDAVFEADAFASLVDADQYLLVLETGHRSVRQALASIEREIDRQSEAKRSEQKRR